MISESDQYVTVGGVYFAGSQRMVTFYARAPGYRYGPPAPASVAADIVALASGNDAEWFDVECLGSFLAQIETVGTGRDAADG